MEFIPADDVFEVERILKKRTHPTRGALYYVKWKNFPPSANTWEPPGNFSHKLINDFEKKHCRKLKRKPPATIQGQTFYVEHNQASKTQPSSDAATNNGALTSQYSTISNNDLASLSSSSTISLSGSSSTTRSPDPLESSFQLPAQLKPKRSRKSSTLSRQQQVQLQMHIEQRQKSARTGFGEGFAVFNSVTCNLPTEGQAPNVVSLHHKLTKEPIIVTDVVTRNQSVTISECSTPEGFFKSPS